MKYGAPSNDFPTWEPGESQVPVSSIMVRVGDLLHTGGKQEFDHFKTSVDGLGNGDFTMRPLSPLWYFCALRIAIDSPKTVEIHQVPFDSEIARMSTDQLSESHACFP